MEDKGKVSMAYPFSRLNFKDYDQDTKILKACNDQMGNKKYIKRGRGLRCTQQYRFELTEIKVTQNKKFRVHNYPVKTTNKTMSICVCKSRVFIQTNKLLEYG